MQKDWQDLLQRIRSNKNATAEENTVLTTEALENSQALFRALPHIAQHRILPTGEKTIMNRKSLSQERISAITKAFLQQQKDNETQVNIYSNIERFNRKIHQIAE